MAKSVEGGRALFETYIRPDITPDIRADNRQSGAYSTGFAVPAMEHGYCAAGLISMGACRRP
jgi:hypothetical protein